MQTYLLHFRLLATRERLAPTVAKWQEYQRRQQQLITQQRSLLLAKQRLLEAQLQQCDAQVMHAACAYWDRYCVMPICAIVWCCDAR